MRFPHLRRSRTAVISALSAGVVIATTGMDWRRLALPGVEELDQQRKATFRSGIADGPVHVREKGRFARHIDGRFEEPG